ncbi:hypothetical protein Z949_2004 [Sulfitobacter guttiformis KCTC 32187]|nr:hypothetical protein Z949_2004 [Sulfitobacter guttiformis KCTC 32187]
MRGGIRFPVITLLRTIASQCTLVQQSGRLALGRADWVSL